VLHVSYHVIGALIESDPNVNTNAVIELWTAPCWPLTLTF